MAQHRSLLVLGEGPAYRPCSTRPHDSALEALGAFVDKHVDPGVTAHRGSSE